MVPHILKVLYSQRRSHPSLLPNTVLLLEMRVKAIYTRCYKDTHTKDNHFDLPFSVLLEYFSSPKLMLVVFLCALLVVERDRKCSLVWFLRSMVSVICSPISLFRALILFLCFLGRTDWWKKLEFLSPPLSHPFLYLIQLRSERGFLVPEKAIMMVCFQSKLNSLSSS